MQSDHALDHAAQHLDDALEALTFERFDWALDELRLATGWLIAPAPDGAPPAVRGEPHHPGTLLARARVTGAAQRVVEHVARIEAELEVPNPSPARVEALVFEAVRWLDEVAVAAGHAEPSVGRSSTAFSERSPVSRSTNNSYPSPKRLREHCTFPTRNSPQPSRRPACNRQRPQNSLPELSVTFRSGTPVRASVVCFGWPVLCS
jgi:hypothetical protein